MTLLALAILLALAVAIAALVRFAKVVWDIGTDVHAVGPWRRKRPERHHTRLPADFIGLWSLFGDRSLRDYAGSREAASRRLDRVEETLRPGFEPPRPKAKGDEVTAASLVDRVKRLESQLGAAAQIGSPDH